MAPQISPFTVVRLVLCLITILIPAEVLLAQTPPADPSSRPDRPSFTWRRVRSAHHVAMGDADERHLRESLADLDAFRAAILQLLPSATFPEPAPAVVLFRDAGDPTYFVRMDGEGKPLTGSRGYYHIAGRQRFIVLQVDPIDRRERALSPLLNYTRETLLLTVPAVPSWLSQGLCELYAAMASDQLAPGHAVGRPLPSRVRALQGATLSPLADLTTPERTSLVVQKNPALYGPQAWAFVHYLMFGRGDDGADRVRRYLELVAAGRSPVDAFAPAFGAPAADMQADFERYVREGAFRGVPLPAPAAGAEASAAPVEAMLESDVEAVQGELALRNLNYPLAQEKLLSALARNPAHQSARLAFASYQLSRSNPGDALALAEPVAAATPTDFRAVSTVGRALYELGRHEAALEALQRAARLEGAHANLWLTISAASAALGREADAAAAMDTVQRMSPGPGWFFTRAQEMWKLGRHEDALRDATVCARAPRCGASQASYAAFLGALSARRLGRAADADALLASVAKAAAADVWTAAVHAFLQGTLPAADFLSKGRHNGEHTEAHAYIGVMASIAGRRDDALTHLRWVRARGARQYTEYGLAMAELKNLE
jgi:tetratricopeptide (TPR) repeat protein